MTNFDEMRRGLDVAFKRYVTPLKASVRTKLLLGAWLAVAGVFWFWSPSAAQASTFLPLVQGNQPPLCRFGVNGELHAYNMRPLRLGWYMDYQATLDADPPEGIAYFPMIRLEQVGENDYNYSIFVDRKETSPSQFEAVVAAHPGAYWFVGNEPDRIQFQDDMEPHVYAQAYHDLYNMIKAEDPGAKIVAGSIVQPTPIRLQYLDMVLDSYTNQYGEPMPVDVWAFHNFVLNEASCSHYSEIYDDPNELLAECWGADIPPGIEAVDGLRIDVQENDDIDLFKEQVRDFRVWLADNGYRDTPVFLSEYGILMPSGLFSPDFDAERVNNFMDQSFDYLLTETDPDIGYPGDNNRLVQRFSWYSVSDNVDHNGFLFNPDKPVNSSRTANGDNFASYARKLDEQVDFYPLSLQGQTDSTDTVTLEAEITNSGNLAISKLAAVRFYDGDPDQGGSQIGVAQVVDLQGCAERENVQVTWAGVNPGEYDVHVKVTTLIDETNVANNWIQETITVD